MKNLIILTALLLTSKAYTVDHWGKPVTLKSPITVEEAIKSFSNKDKKQVLLTAKVKKVCKKKGCWMSLVTKDKAIRVTFKDYVFFVPFRLQNKDVLVQGELIQYDMDVKEAKHYAEDAGENSDHINKAVKEYRIVATGVKLK